MAGRRGARRNSDSSVATVNERNVPWQKETSVLKKKKPGIDIDEWAIFVLNDATVYRKGRRTLANPLEMDYEGPLVVRGRLDIETKEQAKRRTYTRAHAVLSVELRR